MDDTPAPPAPAVAFPPRRGGRAGCLLRGLLAGLVGLLLAVVLLAGWLGGSTSGLRAAVELAGWASGGSLHAEGAEGYLLGEFKLGVLRVSTPALRVDIHELLIRWSPAGLSRGSLEIAALSAAEVAVATAPGDEAATLPASLELPGALRIGDLRIGRLRIGELAGGERVPGPEFTGLSGALASDGRHHRLSGFLAAASFGQLAGEARIDGRRPFPLDATATLSTRQAGEAYTVAARAGGDLEKLKVDATAAGAGMEGSAAIVATPFAPLPLQSARIRVSGADPRRFHPDAPVARLDLDADLRPSAATGATVRPGVADWIVSGPLRIVNRQSGSLDRGALPVESLAARLRWAGGELAVSELDLRLPGQGRADGAARWRAPMAGEAGFGSVDAELRIASLDARQLDGRAPATRIAGSIRAAADAGVQTLHAELSDPQRRLVLEARHAAGIVTVDKLVASANAARLEAAGRLALDAPGSFEASGRLARFDPRAFFRTAPAADINADFRLAGRRQPQLAGQLAFDLASSSVAGRPLAGRGRLDVDGQRLAAADLSLSLAGNRLGASGRYGRPGDALALHLDAPALAALGHGLGGRLQLHGVLRGSVDHPAGEFDLRAEGLALGDMRVAAAAGRGRIGEGRQGVTALNLELAGLRSVAGGEALVREAKLVVSGSRAANSARLEISGRGGNSAFVGLAGALADGPRWEGRLESLELRGDYPVRLQAPAPLLLSRDSVQLGAAELRGASGGRYRFDETRWQARHLVARGSLSAVQVGVILDPATREVKSRGNSLQIGGEWEVDIAEQVNGLVRFYREGGDLELQGDSPVRLGLDELQLTVSAVASRLAFGFSAHGSRLGSASGAGTALAERSADGTIRLVPGAPLLGAARLDIPSIAWAGPLADQNLKTDGSLKGEFTLAGTPVQPEAAGRIRGEGLSFAMADQGLHLSGGTLLADFNRDRLNLEDFSFVSPNRVRPRERRIDVARLTATPGRLGARGAVDLASGEGRFDFHAERLPLLQRADQWLVLSGDGELLTGWNSAHLKGRLTADAGFVELAHTPAPSLGEDVVVLDPAKGSAPASSPFRVSVDLAIGLGDALYVKALGLDTRLAGDLRLSSGAGRPLAATGTITTVGGVFEGYGQKLDIERGIVTFNGPVSNPGLNVVALRKGLAVEAGVGITGTARRPLVRLVSEPNVPDPEKLGWIVLGRPPDQGSGGEMGLLLPAAQALLGGPGGGMSAGLAKALGFDDISFGSTVDSRRRVQTSSVATGSVTGTASSASTSTIDSLPGQVITIGKRLSSQAMLSFEQSIAGTSSIVKLSYQLTRRLALIGRAGSENALDLVFSISFR